MADRNELDPTFPMIQTNAEAMNQCYLILLKPKEKTTHMAVLIDVAGQSTETRVSGLIFHMIVKAAPVDRYAGRIPHETEWHWSKASYSKERGGCIDLGNLYSSIYLHNSAAVPRFLDDGMVRKRNVFFHTYKDRLPS